MKIATYNIWNENKGVGDRYIQIVKQINEVNSDVIGLQEVTPENYLKLKDDLLYEFSSYTQYTDEHEGLAIFSKHKIIQEFSFATSEEYAYSAALHIIVEIDGFRYSITNIHLPWESILIKEKQITMIDQYIKSQKEFANFFILMGDFNCTLQSSVHTYLLGEQSLLERESKPYWFDLASTYSAVSGTANQATLDFLRNPRWGGKNTTEIPVVYAESSL